jgi:hypothetical protein
MELPNFERASRRAFLQRGLSAAGLLAAGALLSACSKSDADTFASVSTTTGTSRSTTTGAGTAAPSTSAAASVDTGAASTVVSFAYTASDSSGRTRNPYIAAWIEDDRGEMVALISVWYLEREAKYLRELTAFAALAGEVPEAQFDAVTGATRSPGEYQLHWDGTGLDGSVLSGRYALWIEAAREHGPHSVMSGEVVLGQAGSTTIPGSGELSDAVVTVG